MIKKDLLKELILSQRKTFLTIIDPIERELISSVLFDKINALKEAIVITGVRRSGKSFLMRLIWKKIKEKKEINNENFLHFNFEDEKLLNFLVTDLAVLLECFHEVVNVNKKSKIYLCLSIL